MDTSGWFVWVKYLFDKSTEKLPITKIQVKNSPQLRLISKEKYRLFQPTDLNDFRPDQVYYAWSTKNVRADDDGVVRPARFKCYIGQMAPAEDKLKRCGFMTLLDYNISESDTSQDEGSNVQHPPVGGDSSENESETDGGNIDAESESEDESRKRIPPPMRPTTAMLQEKARSKRRSHLGIQQLTVDDGSIKPGFQREKESRLLEKENARHVQRKRMEEHLKKSATNKDDDIDRAEDAVLQRIKELEEKLAQSEQMRIESEAKVKALEFSDLSVLKETVLKLHEGMSTLQAKVETLESTLNDGIHSLKASSSGFVSNPEDNSNAKVDMGDGIMVPRWVNSYLENSRGDHTAWAATLVDAVFGKDACLYRDRPKKVSGMKKFPEKFLTQAKLKYDAWLKTLVNIDPVDKVTVRPYTAEERLHLQDTLPAELSKRCQYLWKKEKESNNVQPAPPKNRKPRDPNKPPRPYNRRGTGASLQKGKATTDRGLTFETLSSRPSTSAASLEVTDLTMADVLLNNNL